MKAKYLIVCNLQIVTSHGPKEEAIKPQLLLKQNQKDLNQVGPVLSSGEKSGICGFEPWLSQTNDLEIDTCRSLAVKPVPTLLPTQGIFNFPHHIGVV